MGKRTKVTQSNAYGICRTPKWAWHHDHHLVICANCGEAWTVEELETIGNVMYTAAKNLELLSGRRI